MSGVGAGVGVSEGRRVRENDTEEGEGGNGRIARRECRGAGGTRLPGGRGVRGGLSGKRGGQGYDRYPSRVRAEGVVEEDDIWIIGHCQWSMSI